MLTFIFQGNFPLDEEITYFYNKKIRNLFEVHLMTQHVEEKQAIQVNQVGLD